MTDRTELRRLLEEASKGVPPEGRAIPGTSSWIIVADAPALNLIRATSPKELRPILDQLDAAEAALARVRELHASSGTAESQGYDAEGEYGLIAPYCTGCEASDKYATAWPCPTITAIGGEQP